MRQRTWTDEQLIEAVQGSDTMAAVMRRLGLRPGKYETMRGHIERLGIDASHIRSVGGFRTPRPRSWSDDDLRRAVADSVSLAATMRALG